MKFEVVVQLKPEVLDPEGRAICDTLGRLGFTGLTGVTSSKRFVVSLEQSMAEEEALKTVKRIAEEYLANPVSQWFAIRKLD
jgi:phosphoribosylformylglycinamidine synthase